MSNNPLSAYFRQVLFCVPLKSGVNTYSRDVIELNSNGEVGIRAMTAMDELAFKNPDMILNGDAVKQILKSCVTGLSKPEELLNHDVTYLLLHIRQASSNKNVAHTDSCPKCGHKNIFDINLSAIAEEIPEVKSFYVAELPEINVIVRPNTLKNAITVSLRQFKHQMAIKKLKVDSENPEDLLKSISSEVKEIADMAAEIVLNSVIRIEDKNGVVIVANEGEEGKNYVKEFLNNISIADIEKINEIVNLANISLNSKKVPAKCEKCEHEWTTEVEYNPINFFTES